MDCILGFEKPLDASMLRCFVARAHHFMGEGDSIKAIGACHDRNQAKNSRTGSWIYFFLLVDYGGRWLISAISEVRGSQGHASMLATAGGHR